MQGISVLTVMLGWQPARRRRSHVRHLADLDGYGERVLSATASRGGRSIDGRLVALHLAVRVWGRGGPRAYRHSSSGVPPVPVRGESPMDRAMVLFESEMQLCTG